MEISDITDYNAEAGVISTAVFHPEFLLHTPYLKHTYFYDGANSVIYWAINELLNKKIQNITTLNLEQVINDKPEMKSLMTKYNLDSLSEFMELAVYSKRDTVEEYVMLANRVVELAFKRSFYVKTTNWQRLCFNEKINLEQMNNTVYQELNGLTTQFVTNGQVGTIGDVADKIWEETIQRHERGESYGLPSFFKPWNEYFTYEKTELVVIASRMKNGKSWLALIEALHKASNGVPTMIIDTEMSDSNWFFRAVGYLTGIRESKIKNMELTEHQKSMVEEKIEYLKKLPIYHIFDPLISNEQVYSLVAQKQVEKGLGFLIYDYLKPSDALMESSSRSAELGAKTNFLKNRIAGGLNIPVLAFAQLNRNNEVADSDYIERYASVSVKWEKKSGEEIQQDGVECGTHKMTVKLNRLGKCHMGEGDYIDMKFIGDRPGIAVAKQHTEINPYE